MLPNFRIDVEKKVSRSPAAVEPAIFAQNPTSRTDTTNAREAAGNDVNLITIYARALGILAPQQHVMSFLRALLTRYIQQGILSPSYFHMAAAFERPF
ncbi:unnamed protein product [Ascophyllum nodosum]